MKLSLVTLGPRTPKALTPAATLLSGFVERAGKYAPCSHQRLASEARLVESLQRAPGRRRPVLILADSGGRQFTSVEWAEELGKIRDQGAQEVVIAIGPADGWSRAALAKADRVVSFGRMTLPHELAAVVMAEQVYRALTILAGHPYHSGH